MLSKNVISAIVMLFAGMWMVIGLQYGFWAMDLGQPVWGMAMLGTAFMWGVAFVGAIVVHLNDS